MVLAAVSVCAACHCILCSEGTFVGGEYDKYLLLVLKRNIAETTCKWCWTGYASEINPTLTKQHLT